MYPIILSLEVQNSFEHPNQAQLLAEELRDMAARIEDTTDFTEEDVFLSGAFDGGIEVVPDNLDEMAKWVGELSRDFPDLIFVVDLIEPDLPGDIAKNGDTQERWYIRDGRRQVAEPYLVIPDFDPDAAGEEI
jgi:hypothetical protein